jgi:hypothetical protein
MLMATFALVAGVAAGASTPASRTEPARPCADPSVLCQISPFFCPGTYPAGMEPCWPEEARQPRPVNRPGSGSEAGTRTPEANNAPAAAPRPASPRGTWKVTRGD